MPEQLECKSTGEKINAAGSDSNVSQQLEPKEPVIAVEKPPTDAAKKPGAKQTQSLFPFAKQSKSQAKKERQAKKKDKRKDKDKARMEKIAPTAADTEATTITASQLPGHNHAPKLEIHSGHATAAEATINLDTSPEDSVDTSKSAKETDSTPGAVREEQDEGKQETQRAEIQHSTVAQKAMQTQPGDTFLGACAPYHSEIPSAVSMPQCMPVAAEQQQQLKDADQHARKGKHTPPMIALPKLGDLLKIRPSSPGKASALGTTSPDLGPFKPSKNALETHRTGDGKLAPCMFR
jgi:hypothetical protein